MKNFICLWLFLSITIPAVKADLFTDSDVKLWRRNNAVEISQRKTALRTDWDAIAII